MSGIFDRVKPGKDRVSAHLLKAAIYLGVRGVFTDQQIVDGLNSRLATPLDAASLTDLGTIRGAITSTAALAGKIDLLERFDALNIATEMGLLTNEATYRSELGLP